MSSRIHKSWLNARVNLLFYFLSLFFAFFSRKIFLENLSTDFIGLTGTLGNILGYLNLAELGIGTSISFFLYKPIQSQNKEKINDLISLFGYLYHVIGLVILAAGFIISLFFPLIFKENALGYPIIYFNIGINPYAEYWSWVQYAIVMMGIFFVPIPLCYTFSHLAARVSLDVFLKKLTIKLEYHDTQTHSLLLAQ